MLIAYSSASQLDSAIVVWVLDQNDKNCTFKVNNASACASSGIMTSSPITVAIGFNRQQFRFAFWDSSSCFRLDSEFQIGCCSIVSNKMSQRSRVCIYLSEMQVLVLVLSWQTPCSVSLVQSTEASQLLVDIENDQQDSENFVSSDFGDGELDPVIRVIRLSLMPNRSTNAVT